jgi:hypothetical protein
VEFPGVGLGAHRAIKLAAQDRGLVCDEHLNGQKGGQEVPQHLRVLLELVEPRTHPHSDEDQEVVPQRPPRQPQDVGDLI